MDSDGSRLLFFIVLLVLLRLYYAICEHVLVEVNDSKAREYAESDTRYKSLCSLISNPSKMLSAFSVHRMFSALLIQVLSILFVLRVFDFHNFTSELLAGLAAVIVCTVVLSSVTEMLPRRIAQSANSLSFARVLCGSVKALVIIAKPLSAFINLISFVLCKIFRISVNAKKDTVTEEEILMMVEAGNETGVIEESQREMINNIFEFGDVKISEIMTHRTDIIAIDINSKISDIIYLAMNEGFSRMPVYEDSVDKIIGIMYVKDLLCLVGCKQFEDFNVRDFMRDALYIPFSNKCDEVFEIMTKKKIQMAVVVDEYGGTAGIVTMEDILEEIVGNIQDEYDEEEQEINEVSEGVYIIAGSADPEDILPVLHVHAPDKHEFDTMSALIVDLLGRIPGEDETPSVVYDSVEFTVLLVEDNWISKIKAVVRHADVS
ncbi:MAG: hemolysin family protein [Oscillospiraceae bacterium]|nr:hemolysin family protein [Oscillospiraceae bacterium]